MAEERGGWEGQDGGRSEALRLVRPEHAHEADLASPDLTEGELEALQDALAQNPPSKREWKPAPGDSNPSRARAQGARPSTGEVLEDGSVLRAATVPSSIPEGKRCEALTTLGVRCKAAKMRGLRVCMFHGHLAHDDERLAALADPLAQQEPVLKPRQALKQVAALRAGEMAVAAVDGALTAAKRDGGRSLLSVIDAVDPLQTSTETLSFTAEAIEQGSLKQLLLLKQRRTLEASTAEP
jgi:hypothetical protein